jgi:hypothetical protein
MKGNCLVSRVAVIGCAFATMSLAGVLFTSVPARADIDVSISIGNAPPAPRFVFRSRPHERLYRGERVYVVDDPGLGDNDCFRYGGYYWVFREGYWYRSPSWRSRFVVVHPRYVPTVFYQLPPTRWKHHPNGPPRFTNRGDDGRSRVVNRRDAGLTRVVNRGDDGRSRVVKQGDDGSRGHAKQSGKDDDKQGGRGRK